MRARVVGLLEVDFDGACPGRWAARGASSCSGPVTAPVQRSPWVRMALTVDLEAAGGVRGSCRFAEGRGWGARVAAFARLLAATTSQPIRAPLVVGDSEGVHRA